MTRFPRDAPKRKVVRAFETLGFETIRVGNHISMIRNNPDGSKTLLTMSNHDKIKGSTLMTICRQAGISREVFFEAYQDA